jgi:eukaryotic-like serine/threonine-protein kinase
MWAVAVPFLCFFGIMVTAHLFGPEELGVVSWERDRWRVHRVEPGSAAERCGLRPEDLVVSWNSDSQLGRALWHARALRPDILEIERDGGRLTCTLSLERKSWRLWGTRGGVNRLLSILLSGAWLLLAGFVAWLRPEDTVARWGALLLAEFSVSALYFSDVGSPAGLGQFAVEPFWQIAGLAVVLTAGTVNSVLLTFSALFPRPLFRRRSVFALLWLPATVQIPAMAALHYSLADVDLTPFMALRSLLFLLTAALLVWNYRRLTDPNHRRRVRWFVLGILIVVLAYVPLILVALMPRLIPALAPLATTYRSSYLPVVQKLVMLGSPFCIGLAILKHRLFDIRLMIRQGLQYAAARHLLLATAPLFAGILVLDLVLHADLPLRDVLADRGWLYLVLGAAGLAAHRSQRSWLVALDKRFFREHYDAQAILRGIVEEVRGQGPVAEVADRVTRQIESALHPEVVAILGREASEPAFSVLAQRPASARLPPLRPDSKLAAMLRLLQKPLEVPLTGPGTGWLHRQLPREDVDYLAGARLEWLYPISLGTGGMEGLLVLGAKRSEEPYSEEDQQLLATIASSLALVLERPPAQIVTEPLAEARTEPQLSLGRRYRLLRPLGRGGMGLVYEAEDAELDRRVAVKLMHRELTASPEATTRFRREAKAAAGLCHPNIVTVHDFGVDAEQGAYLVMELLQGASLREELRREGRFAPARAIEVLAGVVAGVTAAHERGLIHRDLKPENVFLVKTQTPEIPKVLDFGIAKAVGGAHTATVGLTTPGQMIGTPRYMSPEQLEGGEPSPSWDTWALAIIAYELLGGLYPFPSEDFAGWRQAISGGQVASLREHLPEASAETDRVLQRALCPRPEDRPASPRQLLDELRRTFVG